MAVFPLLQLKTPYMHGILTRLIQYRLRNRWGYNLVVDGIYGPATAAIVRDFQKKHGLVPDGIVGPATRRALAR